MSAVLESIVTLETSIEAVVLFAETLGIKIACEKRGRDTVLVGGKMKDLGLLVEEIKRQGVSIKRVPS